MKNSEQLYQKALKIIPEQTMTLAKAAHQYPDGAPSYLRSAKGCRVTDVDGNTYIDYTMALGAMLLGYGFPEVENAVIDQLKQGTIYSLPHEIEVELAEKIVEVIPCAEKVRFYKNGADVCGMAIRLARCETGKQHVAYTGYHGHQDWYAHRLRESGTLEEIKAYTHHCPYNDIESFKTLLETHANNVAALMIETAFEAPEPGYLQALRDLCTEHNVTLIFDEMWTGFRFGLAGFQTVCGVQPDLALYSKAIANGYPIAVICGSAKLMDNFEKVWGFTTFGGETLSIRAALETIKFCESHNVAEVLDKKGRLLKDGLQTLIETLNLSDKIELQGYPCRFAMVFKNSDAAAKQKATLQKTLQENGVLWLGQFVLSYSHTEADIAETLSAFEKALKQLV